MTHTKIVFVIILSLAICSGVYAGTRNAAVEYLLFSNSARANGMGATVITLADEQSALSNPGAMGVFHLDHNLALTSPSSTEWLKQALPGLRLKSMGLSAGFASRACVMEPPLLMLRLGADRSRKRNETQQMGLVSLCAGGNRMRLNQLLPVSFGDSVGTVVYSQLVKDVSELPL